MRLPPVIAVALAACLTATGCAGVASAGDGAQRTYYVAADTVIWDYAPDKHNRITGKPFGETENVFLAQGKGRIGPSYQKCIYRGYTDKTFTSLRSRPSSEGYLGFLGPVIRAEVGDTIKVVFRNNCTFPASIHPHGVFYEKHSEGAPYSDGTEGSETQDDRVPPNATYTYTWEVPERAGPGRMDGDSVAWMYHSHADEVADVYAGLAGFMVISADGKAKPDGSPADVDREVFSMFEVMDENASPYLDRNIDMFALGKGDKDDDDFVESNLMHAVNGYVYGNGPTLTLRKGERVRWYLMGMGTEVDLHTPHWHGNTVTVQGMRTDVVNLLPASMAVAEMQPDAIGTWMFHCHVGDHITAGMQALYRVTP